MLPRIFSQIYSWKDDKGKQDYNLFQQKEVFFSQLQLLHSLTFLVNFILTKETTGLFHILYVILHFLSLTEVIYAFSTLVTNTTVWKIN